jgi:biopolymer transport protein ExbD
MRSSAIYKRRQLRRDATMNLTPLVDVMFILMIFILVTAQYTNVYSMKVDLPKAETAQKVGEKKVVVISLSKDEKIFFDDKEVDVAELETNLKALSEQEKAPQVIIQADQQSKTGNLVQVMDLIQKVGLKKVSLQTEK